MRVLLVDDEQEILNMVEEALCQEGFQVETATNGAVALQLLTENTYELLLTDLHMTPVDGRTLIEEVKRMGIEVFTVIFSGYTASLNARDIFENLENVMIIDKPFSLNRLVSICKMARENKVA